MDVFGVIVTVFGASGSLVVAVMLWVWVGNRHREVRTALDEAEKTLADSRRQRDELRKVLDERKGIVRCPLCGGRAKHFCAKCGAKMDEYGGTVGAMPRDVINAAEAAKVCLGLDIRPYNPPLTLDEQFAQATAGVRARHPNVYRDHLK